MAEGNKTEKATPKKRRDERKKGNVFMSKDAVAVASLLAYARWSRGQEVQEFRAGDLTVKKGQAEDFTGDALALLGPYLKPDFVFLGV